MSGPRLPAAALRLSTDPAHSWRSEALPLPFRCESPQLLPNVDIKPFIIWFRSEVSQISVLICAQTGVERSRFLLCKSLEFNFREESPPWHRQHCHLVNSLISARQRD